MPKIVDVEERRTSIARACWRVIVREGIAGLTTRALAREAGVGTGVIFHYFADKDEIVNAAFELLADEFRDQLRARVATARDSLERLRLVARSNLPLDRDRFDEFGVWLSMWAHTYTSEPLRLRQRELYQGWREILANLVRDAISDGLIRPDLDPDLAAIQLAGLTDGLIVELLLDPERPELAGRAAASVDALIDTWALSGDRTSSSQR